MNYGDPIIVQEALSKAKNIEGIKALNIHKSKSVIELFGLPYESKVDNNVKTIFDSGKDKLLSSDDKLRLLKPLVAEKVCLSCHTNSKEGDVLGVIDLSYDLNELNSTIENFSKNTILYLTILSLIAIAIISIFIKKVIFERLELFSDTIKMLLKVEETKEIKKIKQHNKNDEIGEISELFNLYIEKIESNLQKEKLKEIEESVDKALGIKLENTLDLLGTPAVIVDSHSILKYYNNEFVNIFDEMIDADTYKSIMNKSLNVEDVFKSTSFIAMMDFKEDLLDSDECTKVCIESSSFYNSFSISINKFEYEGDTLYMIILIRVENVSSC
jgi:hypothetical protein